LVTPLTLSNKSANRCCFVGMRGRAAQAFKRGALGRMDAEKCARGQRVFRNGRSGIAFGMERRRANGLRCAARELRKQRT